MERTARKRGSFTRRLDSYMKEKRLPKSMKWAGVLAVGWKHFYFNFIIEFLVILIGLFLVLEFTNIQAIYWNILYTVIFSVVWIALRIGWRYIKATATKQEIIIAKDGTLRERSPSQWTLVWRRYKKNKIAVLSGAIVILVTIIAIIYPILMPFSPVGTTPLFDAWNGGGSLSNPNLKYPGGTDVLGRDE